MEAASQAQQNSAGVHFRYFVEATDMLNLTRERSPDPSFGIFDGERFIMTSDTSLWSKAWRCASLLFPQIPPCS